MCFSASASFLAAATMAAIGVACIRRTTRTAELPLAAMPLIFGIQQAVEGFLWLSLSRSPGEPLEASALALAFLIIAQVFWPIYAPVSVILVEPRTERRRYMFMALAIGLGVGLGLFWTSVMQPQSATMAGGHIVYSVAYQQPVLLALAYLAATGFPLAMSSHHAVAALGGIVSIGSAVTYLAYRDAFVSVWCFFAAVASGVIFFHFERSRRRHLVPLRAS